MSDIKTVIALLCKDLRQAVDATLEPEHIRSAKFDKDTNNTVIELWKILYRLSFCTLEDTPGEIFLNSYDDITSVKLYFAYLQYLVPEFYALRLNCRGASRELLFAFTWLLATKNVLTVAIDKKISNSILAVEFSDKYLLKDSPASHNDDFSSTNAQLNRLIHVCGQTSYNVKIISELVSEKVKLATKAHAASINVSGLPHLGISEMSMIKSLAVQKSVGNEQYSQDLHELASVLETHAKWEARRHIFFDWMVTIIEEHKISRVEAVSSRESDLELSRFVCLLRHIVKKNLHNLKNIDEISPDLPSSEGVSRFLRTQSSYPETEAWISEVKQQLKNEEEVSKKEAHRLVVQLKKMLKLIPHCVKI